MAVVIENRIATFSVHFDGPIALDHRLTVRDMARTYEHVQRAIDRSFLIGKYGSVYKHARLKAEDYAEVDFIAAYPREGGIILDALRENGGAIIDRIASAIQGPFDRALQGGIDEIAELNAQIAQRRQYARNMGRRDVQTLQDLLDNPPPGWSEAYSKRSILKEVDQITTLVTSDRNEGSIVELGLRGERLNHNFGFTSEIAERFHALVAAREVGPTVRMRARIRDLDRGNRFAKPRAKILNIDSGREASLHLRNASDFEALHPYHTADEVMLFVSPYVEAGGFDLKGGDLIFIGIAE